MRILVLGSGAREHAILLALQGEDAGHDLLVAPGNAGIAQDATIVALDPLDEGAQRLLIAAHARAGNRARALRQYLACRKQLVDALGLEPSEETRALHRRVLAGQPV